jgi:hypothetical protein
MIIRTINSDQNYGISHTQIGDNSPKIIPLDIQRMNQIMGDTHEIGTGQYHNISASSRPTFSLTIQVHGLKFNFLNLLFNILSLPD